MDGLEQMAFVVVMVGGKFQGMAYKNLEAAASWVFDALVSAEDEYNCMHSIQNHLKEVVWRYEGGHSASLARLMPLLHPND